MEKPQFITDELLDSLRAGEFKPYRFSLTTNMNPKLKEWAAGSFGFHKLRKLIQYCISGREPEFVAIRCFLSLFNLAAKRSKHGHFAVLQVRCR
jgi:hypothetical protein